jgi:hypothetical protein
MRKFIIAAALVAATAVPAFAGKNATVSASSVAVNQTMGRPNNQVSVPSRPVSIPSVPSRPAPTRPSL